MEYRIANDKDLDLLANWNHQLIQDEVHRNRMSVIQLKERMREWITTDYTAIVFSLSDEPVPYALFRENPNEIYLRQFFVRRDKRRQGIGREAVNLLLQKVWPISKRLTVEVLCQNQSGIDFWRSVGYKDYCLTLVSRGTPMCLCVSISVILGNIQLSCLKSRDVLSISIAHLMISNSASSSPLPSNI